MQTVNQQIAVLLTSIFEKQITIRDLADDLIDEIHETANDRNGASMAVAIRELADKQNTQLNDLESKLESQGVDTSDHGDFTGEDTTNCDKDKEEIRRQLLKIWEAADQMDGALAFQEKSANGSLDKILPVDSINDCLRVGVDSLPNKIIMATGDLSESLGIELHPEVQS